MIVFDSGSEVSQGPVSSSAMFPEVATVLLGACVGAVVVIYAAARGYLGGRKKAAPVTSTVANTTAAEQAAEVPAVEAPAVAEQAPAAPEPSTAPEPKSSPGMYETVQPSSSPVTFSAPSAASIGSPTLAKKPTRTYRRRTAPVRSTAGVKKNVAKPKKR